MILLVKGTAGLRGRSHTYLQVTTCHHTSYVFDCIVACFSHTCLSPCVSQALIYETAFNDPLCSIYIIQIRQQVYAITPFYDQNVPYVHIVKMGQYNITVYPIKNIHRITQIIGCLTATVWSVDFDVFQTSGGLKGKSFHYCMSNLLPICVFLSLFKYIILSGTQDIGRYVTVINLILF